MAKRTFTLNEAQDLLPILESLLRKILECKRKKEAIDARFQEVNHKILLRGGMLLDIVPLARLRAEHDKLIQSMNDAEGEIEAMGVQVKDRDIGLLDFPCVVDGQIILLCWKMGEARIGHWHGTEEGFAGRKMIDERILNANKRRRSKPV